jgi:HAE1 family hydrophobic/amphiphilic exporter-1
MDIIKFSINKPVTVFVGVILVVLFGVIGLISMPYQLSPDVTEPEITVTTNWPGASPYEIERDVIEEQEKVLKGIPGLIEMESSSFNGQGTVTLRFKIDTDVDDALLRVSNKMNEVPSYPENVEKPVINATGAATSPVIWMILKTDPGNDKSASTYKTYFENEIRQYLERVEGVADLFIGGGTEKQMHIIVKPEKLAAHKLSVSDLVTILRAENINVSAGNVGVGRRDYRIRTIAEFRSPQDIGKIVIASTGQRRITVSDVAQIQFGYEKRTVAMIHNGQEGIAIGVKPEPGTNILNLSDNLEQVVKSLNDEKLNPLKVSLEWVYDQRPYIRGAIDLVKRNIFIGSTLAVVVLLIFLRSISSTIVVSTAIPISVIGTFIIMNALGRNLNVISLAGIAFAVGMLVDNAIVVLENIDRHRKMGKPPFDAAYDGAREVWGAVLASTLTTIAVFLPVVFVQEEAGQLFRDIAIAVTCAVSLSLFVSVSVIPMLSEKLFSFMKEKPLQQRRSRLVFMGKRMSDFIMGLVRVATRNRMTRFITIISLTAFALVTAVLLFPKMEYLPQGNRNLVINLFVPPPGLSYEERKEIGDRLFETLEPHMGKDKEGFPGIKNMFYVGAEQIMISGAISTHEQMAGELVPLFMGYINSIPGIFGVSNQAGIFQTRLGRGRTIDVDVSGDDLNRTIEVAQMLFGKIMQEIPGSQIRPLPSLEVLYPEVRLIPERDRIKAAGMSAAELGITLDVLMDGRKIGDFKEEGEKKVDLVLKASENDVTSPEELYRTIIVTPEGKGVPISSFTELVRTTGVTEIRHLERKRTITLQVTPPFAVPMEQAMDQINANVIGQLKKSGLLSAVDVNQSGVADKLTETRKVLQWDFLLAAVIAYLLMAALFGNFIYPFVIMFTLPLGAAGGFIGLALVNVFLTTQPLDILTMLGFVILVGIIVNNAILIVHQSLNNIRYQGMDYRDAVLESVRTRLRPIYMSASTSIFGMLPLVIAPGPGSELYRGLGSVILGGIAVSTIFTVFVIPSLLLFFIGMEKRTTNKSGETAVNDADAEKQ